MSDGDRDEILERLDRLEVAIARLAPRSRLSRADLLRLAALLPALVTSFPRAEAFTVREVLQQRDLRSLIAGLSGKALGKLLLRAEGHLTARCVVRRVGTENSVALWAVEPFGVSGVSGPIKAA